MWTQLAGRLTTALFGAGTGLGTDVLPDTLNPAPLLAAEPSAHLRAVLLARFSVRRDAGRVTVFPTCAAQLPLPERVAAATGLHMIGHLATAERRVLFTALMPRLAPGAPAVFNVQPPDTAVEVPETPPFGVTAGRLRYEGKGARCRQGRIGCAGR